jgi:hypothetical protein
MDAISYGIYAAAFGLCIYALWKFCKYWKQRDIDRQEELKQWRGTRDL